MDIPINWLTVLAAGVVNFVVGWLWYGPIFGNIWKGLMGFTDESMKNMKMTPVKAMTWGFISSLVTAYALAYIFGWFQVTDLGSAMKTACLIWLGFLATASLGSYLWEGKPFKLFVLNAVEQFIAIHLVALVLVMWQ